MTTIDTPSGRRHDTSDRSRGRGFTLIELLVVIAIIALLVSILVPSLREARNLAQRAVCTVNERHIVNAATIYAGDFQEVYPLSNGPMTTVARKASDNSAVLYGMCLLSDQELLPRSEAGVAETYFCPAWDASDLSIANGQAWKIVRMLENNPSNNYVSSSYVGRFCGKHEYNPHPNITDEHRRESLLYASGVKDQTASHVAPVLVVDAWLDILNRTAHQDQGYCAGFQDGHARWIDFDELSWSPNTPSWHIAHPNHEMPENKRVAGNFHHWARDRWGTN